MATSSGGITLRVHLHVLDVAAECADLQRGSKAARASPVERGPWAAGPVPGLGPCARRTLPAFRVAPPPHSAWPVPGAPAARAQPSRRCHPRPTTPAPPLAASLRF